MNLTVPKFVWLLLFAFFLGLWIQAKHEQSEDAAPDRKPVVVFDGHTMNCVEVRHAPDHDCSNPPTDFEMEVIEETY